MAEAIIRFLIEPVSTVKFDVEIGSISSRIPTDTIWVGDNVSIANLVGRDVADTVTIGDSSVQSVTFTRNVADGSVVLDYAETSPPHPDDYVSPADGAALEVSRASADTVTAGDAVVKHISKAFADTATQGDSIQTITGPAVYVMSAKRETPSASPMSITGASAEDLMVVLLASSATISGGDGGWTYTSAFGPGWRAAYKVLTDGDISGSLISSTDVMQWAVYSNAKSISLKGTGGASGTSFNVAGFTKAANCAGMIGLGMGSSVTANVVFTAMTARRNAAAPSAFIVLSLDDYLTPNSYVNGTSWHCTASSGGTSYGALLEILH